jgi:hypothetical protein
MKFKRYNLAEAEDGYTRLEGNGFKYIDAPDKMEMRDLLFNLLDNVWQKYEEKYAVDLECGLGLYKMFSPDKIGLRTAADDGVWKYLALEIVPDIVKKRWGENPDHFYLMNRRLWLKTLWWYVHLSWQEGKSWEEGEEKTRLALKFLTTNNILQLVERPGRFGYRLSLYREIMKHVHTYEVKLGRKDIIPYVMKLNTAFVLSTEPDLSEGGVEGYVKRLFESLKFDVNINAGKRNNSETVATKTNLTANANSSNNDVDKVETSPNVDEVALNLCRQGDSFLNDRGDHDAYAQAAKYYQRAADKLLASAQFKLGKLYESGCGVALDQKEALKLYSLASAQKYPPALRKLAEIYDQGLFGVKKNPVMADQMRRFADQLGEGNY